MRQPPHFFRAGHACVTVNVWESVGSAHRDRGPTATCAVQPQDESHSHVEGGVGGEGGAQRVMGSVGAGVSTGVNGQRDRVPTKLAHLWQACVLQSTASGQEALTPFSQRSLCCVLEREMFCVVR